MNITKRLARARHKARMRSLLRHVNVIRNKNMKMAITDWPRGSEKVGKFE